jgi:O-methyltransferase involved in polyketide biosynthesis
MPLDLIDGVARSSLGTLSSRAILGDSYAKKFIDYLNGLKIVRDMNGFSFAPAILRGYIYDRWIGDVIRDKPDFKVLNLGCGFCTRYFYIRSDTLQWTESDLPDVIALRENSGVYVKDNPNYKTLALDLNNFDLTILNNYDLVVAEGCLCYLEKARVLEIVGHCKHLICDVIGDERKLELSNVQKWKYNYEDFKHLPITREFRYTYYSRDDRVLEFKQVRDEHIG